MKPVEQNFLDKVVTFVSPVAGAKRLAARSALAWSGAYTGARYDKRETMNWWTSRGSADADTLPDLPELRPRCRDLSRNNALAGGAVNTVVLNTAATGLTLQPTPDREILGWSEDEGRAWSKTTGHEFAMWAESKDCDVTRTQNLYGLQELVTRGQLDSGDCLTIITQRTITGNPYSTALQIIEADRLKTPGAEGMPAVNDPNAAVTVQNGNRIYGGVEQDKMGAPVAYCILRQHPGAIGYASATANQYDRYLAFGPKTGRRNVLHHFDRLRPDQARGVPYLAPVIEYFKQLGRYTEAELMATVLNAMVTGFVTTETGDVGLGETTPTAPPSPGELSLGNGTIWGLQPNQKIEFPVANRANPGFDAFVTSICRQIGVALQLPFEILIKHFTSSYSAARAALLEAWKFYGYRRNHLAGSFCQPVYEAWMDEAVSVGRIKAPGYFTSPLMRRAYLSADWIGDAPGQIDPLKEGQASKLLIDEGLSNLHIETMRLTGRNWEDVHPDRVREHELRAAEGLEPNVLNATGTEMVPDTADQQDDSQTAPDPTTQPEPEPKPPAKPAPKRKGSKR